MFEFILFALAWREILSRILSIIVIAKNVMLGPSSSDSLKAYGPLDVLYLMG